MEPQLKIRVQLFIKCTGLKDVEIINKSDPYIEVFEKRSGSWSLIGKTEVIWDSLDPEFSTCIELDYLFEVETTLNFKIFDMNLDRNGREVQGEFLGQSEYSLSQIVGNKGHWLMKKLHDDQSKLTNGHIFVRADEVNENSNTLASIVFEGVNLNVRTGCFQSLRPMFILYRMMEADNHQKVYTSEVSKGKNPKWKEVSKNVRELASGVLIKPLIFELIDYSRFGKHKSLGRFNFTLNEIKEDDKKSFRIFSENGGQNRDIGEVKIASANFVSEPTFLDYIYGGCSINLVIGVDFTSSNGDPKSPDSLHYIDPLKHNQYQSALYSVGKILLPYDSDKDVPMFGFGATVNGQANHCFEMKVDNNNENPNVEGIKGVMKAYKETLDKVILSAPTNFAPIISKTVSMAKDAGVSQLTQQYFILVIITDGMISDIRDTIDIIVEGSHFPLSIIIVGVGDANFESMEELNSNDKMLENSRREKAERDIVQFVHYSNFSDNIDELSKEVLKEIPREIKGYFMSRKIIPNPKMYDHNIIEYKESEVDLNEM